jgi:DNA-directed RNA polymerase subunit omega
VGSLDAYALRVIDQESDFIMECVVEDIPDDPDQSTYRFIIVAAKRARQLQAGARPFLPTSSKKPTVIAAEEVRCGLVKYEIPGKVVKEEVAPEKV